MSPTGPRPADVVFDHAAAATAVAALDRASSVLDDVGSTRSRARATAREHFRGVAADDFAAADAELGRSSATARSEVLALRGAIVAASEAAAAAQVARTGEQAAWDAAQLAPPPARAA